MSVVTAAPAARPSHRGPALVLAIAALSALAFFVMAAVPYLINPAFNAEIFGSKRPALLAHIGFGTLTLFAGPVQIWLGLTDRRMTLHKNLGFVYMLGVVGGSLAAYAMLLSPSAGWVYGAGLAGLATAWLATTGMAFLAIKRHLIDQHKEWMIRSYVITFGFVVFRVGAIVLAALKVGSELEQAQVMAWAAWTIPLVITELILQGRKILAVRPI